MITQLPIDNLREYERYKFDHGIATAKRYKAVILQWINRKNDDEYYSEYLPQESKKRDNSRYKIYFYKGAYYSSEEMAAMGPMSRTTFLNRVKAGMTPEEAIKTKTNRIKPKKL